MSTVTIVGSWEKNSRESVIVRLDEIKGTPIVDCRVWYKTEDGELKPGRNGLTVSVIHLPALAEAMTKACSLASSPLPEGWDSPQDS